jgi:hypothetical protein
LGFPFIYRDGEFVTKIAINECGQGIIPLTENFFELKNLIRIFCTHVGQTKSSKKLAVMMAGEHACFLMLMKSP